MSRPHTASASVEIPPPGGYRIDPAASTISFTTRHMFGLGAVRGTFALREGHVEVADPVLESSALARIDATSFDTRNPTRDKTVRSRTYLDVENHPEIGFASTRLDRDGDDWVLHGTLTVCGRTEPVELRIESASVAGSALRVKASMEIDRYRFGVTAMKGMTGRRLRLVLDLTARPVS